MMAGPRLTMDQRHILTMLELNPWVSARQLLEELQRQVPRHPAHAWTMDQVTASLARMARRDLVWHDHSRPRRWLAVEIPVVED